MADQNVDTPSQKSVRQQCREYAMPWLTGDLAVGFQQWASRQDDRVNNQMRQEITEGS